MNRAATDIFVSEYHRVRLPFDPERGKVWRAFSRLLAASEKWALDINPGMICHRGESVHPLLQSGLDRLLLQGRSHE